MFPEETDAGGQILGDMGEGGGSTQQKRGYRLASQSHIHVRHFNYYPRLGKNSQQDRREPGEGGARPRGESVSRRRAWTAVSNAAKRSSEISLKNVHGSWSLGAWPGQPRRRRGPEQAQRSGEGEASEDVETESGGITILRSLMQSSG